VVVRAALASVVLVGLLFAFVYPTRTFLDQRDDTNRARAQLALLKPTAFFLNMARGPVVDEAALIEVLKARRIAGAGIDVFEQEPVDPANPLLRLDNVIVTPHALCWTDQCFHDIAAAGLKSIVDVSLGRRPLHLVNPQAWKSAA